MKTLFQCLMMLLLLQQSAEVYGQSWQWSKRGGNRLGSTDDERVRGIAIDQHGNSYTLAQVYSDKVLGDINIDSISVGKGNNELDICLVSFDCAGKLRWSKVIGGRYNDEGFGLKVDTLGGVYLTGFVIAGNMHDSIAVDKDTMIYAPKVAPFRIFKTMFVMKFDTSGNFKWMRMPEPDTMSAFNHSGSISMDISPTGTLSILTYVNHTGAFAGGGYIVPVTAKLPSMHMLQYDRDGRFIKGFPMDISEGNVRSLSAMRMVWDYKRDVYYVLSLFGGPGFVAPKFGSTLMSGTNCLAKFSSMGSNIWVSKSKNTEYVGTYRIPVLDDDGNIYFGSSESLGNEFGSFTATNTLSTSIGVPILLKINGLDGSVMWGQSVSATYSAGGTAVGVSSDGTVGFTTVHYGEIGIGPYRSLSSGSAMKISFIRFDQHTGALKGFDTINTSNIGGVEIIATDKKANFYLGGYFDGKLEVPGSDTLRQYGGRNDFFLIKYGTAVCAAPVSLSGITSNTSWRVYPNPTREVLTIEGMGLGSRVQVMNLLGQVVLREDASSTVQQLSVAALPSGMYLLYLHQADGTVFTTKFLKE